MEKFEALILATEKKLYHKANLVDVNRKYVVAHLKKLIQEEDQKEFDDIMREAKTRQTAMLDQRLLEAKAIVYSTAGILAYFYNRFMDAPILDYYRLTVHKDYGDYERWLNALQEENEKMHDIFFARYFLRELINNMRRQLGLPIHDDNSETKDMLERTYLELWKSEVDFAAHIKKGEMFGRSLLTGVGRAGIIDKYTTLASETLKQLDSGIDDQLKAVCRVKMLAIDKFMNRVKNLYQKIIAWVAIKNNWEGTEKSEDMMVLLDNQLAKWQAGTFTEESRPRDPFYPKVKMTNVFQYVPVNWDSSSLYKNGLQNIHPLKELLKAENNFKSLSREILERALDRPLEEIIFCAPLRPRGVPTMGTMWEGTPGMVFDEKKMTAKSKENLKLLARVSREYKVKFLLLDKYAGYERRTIYKFKSSVDSKAIRSGVLLNQIMETVKATTLAPDTREQDEIDRAFSMADKLRKNVEKKEEKNNLALGKYYAEPVTKIDGGKDEAWFGRIAIVDNVSQFGDPEKSERGKERTRLEQFLKDGSQMIDTRGSKDFGENPSWVVLYFSSDDMWEVMKNKEGDVMFENFAQIPNAWNYFQMLQDYIPMFLHDSLVRKYPNSMENIGARDVLVWYYDRRDVKFWDGTLQFLEGSIWRTLPKVTSAVLDVYSVISMSSVPKEWIKLAEAIIGHIQTVLSHQNKDLWDRVRVAFPLTQSDAVSNLTLMWVLLKSKMTDAMFAKEFEKAYMEKVRKYEELGDPSKYAIAGRQILKDISEERGVEWTSPFEMIATWYKRLVITKIDRYIMESREEKKKDVHMAISAKMNDLGGPEWDILQDKVAIDAVLEDLMKMDNRHAKYLPGPNLATHMFFVALRIMAEPEFTAMHVLQSIYHALYLNKKHDPLMTDQRRKDLATFVKKHYAMETLYEVMDEDHVLDLMTWVNMTGGGSRAITKDRRYPIFHDEIKNGKDGIFRGIFHNEFFVKTIENTELYGKITRGISRSEQFRDLIMKKDEYENPQALKLYEQLVNLMGILFTEKTLRGNFGSWQELLTNGKVFDNYVKAARGNLREISATGGVIYKVILPTKTEPGDAYYAYGENYKKLYSFGPVPGALILERGELEAEIKNYIAGLVSQPLDLPVIFSGTTLITDLSNTTPGDMILLDNNVPHIVIPQIRENIDSEFMGLDSGTEELVERVVKEEMAPFAAIYEQRIKDLNIQEKDIKEMVKIVKDIFPKLNKSAHIEMTESNSCTPMEDAEKEFDKLVTDFANGVTDATVRGDIMNRLKPFQDFFKDEVKICRDATNNFRNIESVSILYRQYYDDWKANGKFDPGDPGNFALDQDSPDYFNLDIPADPQSNQCYLKLRHYISSADVDDLDYLLDIFETTCLIIGDVRQLASYIESYEPSFSTKNLHENINKSRIHGIGFKVMAKILDRDFFGDTSVSFGKIIESVSTTLAKIEIMQRNMIMEYHPSITIMRVTDSAWETANSKFNDDLKKLAEGTMVRVGKYRGKALVKIADNARCWLQNRSALNIERFLGVSGKDSKLYEVALKIYGVVNIKGTPVSAKDDQRLKSAIRDVYESEIWKAPEKPVKDMLAKLLAEERTKGGPFDTTESDADVLDAVYNHLHNMRAYFFGRQIEKFQLKLVDTGAYCQNPMENTSYMTLEDRLKATGIDIATYITRSPANLAFTGVTGSHVAPPAFTPPTPYKAVDLVLNRGEFDKHLGYLKKDLERIANLKLLIDNRAIDNLKRAISSIPPGATPIERRANNSLKDILQKRVNLLEKVESRFLPRYDEITAILHQNRNISIDIRNRIYLKHHAVDNNIKALDPSVDATHIDYAVNQFLKEQEDAIKQIDRYAKISTTTLHLPLDSYLVEDSYKILKDIAPLFNEFADLLGKTIVAKPIDMMAIGEIEKLYFDMLKKNIDDIVDIIQEAPFKKEIQIVISLMKETDTAKHLVKAIVNEAMDIGRIIAELAKLATDYNTATDPSKLTEMETKIAELKKVAISIPRELLVKGTTDELRKLSISFDKYITLQSHLVSLKKQYTEDAKNAIKGYGAFVAAAKKHSFVPTKPIAAVPAIASSVVVATASATTPDATQQADIDKNMKTVDNLRVKLAGQITKLNGALDDVRNCPTAVSAVGDRGIVKTCGDLLQAYMDRVTRQMSSGVVNKILNPKSELSKLPGALHPWIISHIEQKTIPTSLNEAIRIRNAVNDLCGIRSSLDAALKATNPQSNITQAEALIANMPAHQNELAKNALPEFTGIPDKIKALTAKLAQELANLKAKLGTPTPAPATASASPAKAPVAPATSASASPAKAPVVSTTPTSKLTTAQINLIDTAMAEITKPLSSVQNASLLIKNNIASNDYIRALANANKFRDLFEEKVYGKVKEIADFKPKQLKGTLATSLTSDVHDDAVDYIKAKSAINTGYQLFEIAQLLDGVKNAQKYMDDGDIASADATLVKIEGASLCKDRKYVLDEYKQICADLKANIIYNLRNAVNAAKPSSATTAPTPSPPATTDAAIIKSFLEDASGDPLAKAVDDELQKVEGALSTSDYARLVSETKNAVQAMNTVMTTLRGNSRIAQGKHSSTVQSAIDGELRNIQPLNYIIGRMDQYATEIKRISDEFDTILATKPLDQSKLAQLKTDVGALKKNLGTDQRGSAKLSGSSATKITNILTGLIAITDEMNRVMDDNMTPAPAPRPASSSLSAPSQAVQNLLVAPNKEFATMTADINGMTNIAGQIGTADAGIDTGNLLSINRNMILNSLKNVIKLGYFDTRGDVDASKTAGIPHLDMPYLAEMVGPATLDGIRAIIQNAHIALLSIDGYSRGNASEQLTRSDVESYIDRIINEMKNIPTSHPLYGPLGNLATAVINKYREILPPPTSGGGSRSLNKALRKLFAKGGSRRRSHRRRSHRKSD